MKYLVTFLTCLTFLAKASPVYGYPGYPDNWTPWNWGGYQSCSVAASRAYEERIRQYQYQYSAAPFHPTDGTWAGSADQLNTNLQNAAITYVNLCDNL